MHKYKPQPKLRWHSHDIKYHDIDAEKVKSDFILCFALILSSFAESRDYPYPVPEPCIDSTLRYIEDVWEPEEVQHGVALRKCVEHIFPKIEWEYHCKEYMKVFMHEAFPTFDLKPDPLHYGLKKAFEEICTSTIYTTMYNAAKRFGDPTLQKVLLELKYDECGHYVAFEKMFKEEQSKAPVGLIHRTRFLFKRIAGIRNSDFALLFPVVKRILITYNLFDKKEIYDKYGLHIDTMSYDQFYKHYNKWLKQNYPYEMAIHMFSRLLFPNSKRMQKIFKPIGMTMLKVWT